jgi:hypothetical protein
MSEDTTTALPVHEMLATVAELVKWCAVVQFFQEVEMPGCRRSRPVGPDPRISVGPVLRPARTHTPDSTDHANHYLWVAPDVL